MKKMATVAVLALIAGGLGVSLSRVHSQSNESINGRYVAMGDSFSAGNGLGSITGPVVCGRTSHAYPVIVAHSLRLKLDNLSCAGASITNGISADRVVGGVDIQPQIDALYAGQRPQLITLTVGLNDTKWLQAILQCETYITCSDNSNQSQFNAQLTSYKSKLSQVLDNIKEHYQPLPPKLIITGYNQTFAANSQCVNSSGLNASQIAWIRQRQSNLNQTIRQVAEKFDFVKYSQVDFSGHESCAIDSWLLPKGVNSPYHPNAIGQTIYARQVIKTYQTIN